MKITDDIVDFSAEEQEVEQLLDENTEVQSEERKIVFRHGRAPGDNVMLTAGVRDFALLFPDIKINVESPYKWLWENNPYIDSSIKRGDPDVEYYEVGYPSVGAANQTNVHFTQMFLLDMIAVTDLHNKLPISLGEFCSAFANGDVGDPALGNPKKTINPKQLFVKLREKYKGFCNEFARQRGDIHLSEEEKKYNLVQEVYGVEKYWLIAPGGKRDFTAKIWDWRRFQEVIDYFDGRIKFVVMGRSDLLIEKLNNVIDLVDKFNDNPRGLIPLVYHAEGCVCGPSLLLHLAAAVPPKYGNNRRPCVAIFGGREPTGWSAYTNHQILHTNAVFSCCSSGGCWKARVYPIPKDIEKNKDLCRKPVESEGRTIQACMDVITSQDVIRAVERYYEGDLRTYTKNEKLKKAVTLEIPRVEVVSTEKEINLVGNLNTQGGGEQSLCMISKVLSNAGWKVNLYPWGSVNKIFSDVPNVMPYSFEKDMADNMKEGLPLLFYANDCVRGFAEKAKPVVDKSSAVIIGINYMNGPLPSCSWLSNSGKVKAVIFQNEEKRDEWLKSEIGYEGTRKYVMFGAIELDKFLEVCTKNRDEKDDLVVLRVSVPDYRKFVTADSVGRGEKKHIWQKYLDKELDTKFYERLLSKIPNIRFEFMEAHKELISKFKNEKRMVFYKWNSMPVTEFLSRGHVYLYRTSNLWRDNYPRGMAEALAAGLPVIGEPRDGPKDRIQHGDTGFYFTHFDECLVHLKTLQRKEKFRQHLGRNAKDWARINLDPRRWADVVEEILYG